MIVKNAGAEGWDEFSSFEKALPEPPIASIQTPSDDPPPYARTGNTVANRVDAPRPTINNVFIHTRRKPISATFRINPDAPMGFIQKNKCCGSRRIPNASFRTRHAPIALDLGIAGTTNENVTAFVHVGNRSGDIMINMFELHPHKRVNLEVISRKGNIVILLPRKFCGAVQLRSRKGTMTFLPELSRILQIGGMTDREAIGFVGQGPVPSDAFDDNRSQFADFCQISSKKGNIVLGLSGEDTYKQEEGGFWKWFSGRRRVGEGPDADASGD